jgi:TPR repeat protein
MNALNALKNSIIIMFGLWLSGCQSTSGESPAFNETLHKKMTHSYCYQYMYGGYGSGIDYDKAYFWCGKSIINGNPKSMALMGEIYLLGLGQPVDTHKALYWYENAAELGHNHAQFMLAHLYHEGLGVNRSPELALKWNKKALFNNHLNANRQKKQWNKDN